MATQRFDLDGNDVGPEEDEEIVSTPEEEAHLRDLEEIARQIDNGQGRPKKSLKNPSEAIPAESEALGIIGE